MTRIKKYCEFCRKMNGGTVNRFYINGEEKCEVDGAYLIPFIGGYKAVTNAAANAVTNVATNTATDPHRVQPSAVVKTNVPSSTIKNIQKPSTGDTKKINNAVDKTVTDKKTVNLNTQTIRSQQNIKTPSGSSVGTSSVVESIFASRNLIGMKDAMGLLDRYYSEWDTERLKSTLGIGAKEDRTIAKMSFIIVGDELSGKSEFAKVVSSVLIKAGIRTNDGPQIIRLKEFEAVLGIDAELDKFRDRYKNKVVLVEDSLDEAFMSRDGEIEADANKISDLLYSIRYLGGVLTLIFEISPKMKEELYSTNPRLSDYFCMIPIGKYSDEQLYDLAVKRITGDFKYLLSENAKEMLRRKIRQTSFEDFSQGRFILDVFVQAQDSLRKRLETTPANSKEDRYTFTADDIQIKTFDEEAANEIMEKINRRVGQESLKKYAREIYDLAKDNHERILNGKKPGKPKMANLILEGGPGSGKTTSCELIAKLLHACGMLTNPEPNIVSIADMQKDAIGGTSQQVKKCFAETKGGLLVIDEAYSLTNDGSYGKDIVDTLTNELGKESCDVIVALLGYPGTLDPVIEMNKGMKRRFPNKIVLNDFSLEEMVEIFKSYATDNDLSVDPDADEMISKLIDSKRRTQDFGNAGGVINIIDDMMRSGVIARSGDRITKQLLLDEMNAGKGNAAEEALDELNSMIGIKEAKEAIKKLIDSIKGKQKLAMAGIRVPEEKSLNMIIEGPPGTGKTTFCKLFAKLAASYGVIKYSDKIVETSGKDFIAGYVGQTEGKVKEIINKAIGGVLYIDEVYQMDNDTQFGQSAIDGLCDQIDARGGSLLVIISGYKDKMTDFLNKNPGLESRFKERIEFMPYSEEELFEIFKLFLHKSNVRLDQEPDVELKIRKWIEAKMHQDNFGNARDIRNLCEICVRNLLARVSTDDYHDPSEYNLIKEQDIPNVA